MDAETLVSEPERMEEGSKPEEDQDEEEEDFTVQVGATYSCKRQDGTYHDAEVVKSRMNKRAGREEFYVHYIGLPCRQNEWVDKPRLVLVNPVKEIDEEAANETAANETAANETAANETAANETAANETAANETAANETAANETAANETVQEKTENGDASENQKSDEPLAKKIKVEVHDPPANSSLVAPEEFAEELTCPLCIELFKDPVVVECGHNFCRSCLDEAWEGQESFTCPDCKEVITDRKYMSNRALANLVKKSAHPAKSVVKEKPRLPEKCLVHDERLKLFCKDDGDLGCIICRESLKHTNHNFLPILDAVGVYRSELTSIVSPLEDALKMAEQMAKQQNEKIENHRTNMEECQEHIKSEFAKLHQLLTEREDKLLQKLHEEGSSLLTEMEANIAKMQENISSIKESISLASEKLGNTDAVSFLTDIKSLIKKCNEQQKEALSSGNTLIDKELSKDTYKAPIKSSICDEERTPAPPSNWTAAPPSNWTAAPPSNWTAAPPKVEELQSQVPKRAKPKVALDINGKQLFVDQCREALIKWVPVVDPILDSLVSLKLLTNEQYDDVRSKTTSQKMMRELYSISRGWSAPHKANLFDALQKHNTPLIQHLMEV